MLISLNNKEALRHEDFSHEMYLRDRNNQFHDAKAEGIAEGKIEIVKNMLKLNLSKEIISKSTGLSIKEIEEIIKE